MLVADITAAGDAGAAKFRPAIYLDNGSGYPGALLLDPGQLAADAIAVVETTLGSTLTVPAGVYWIGGVVQGVATTQPTVRCVATSVEWPIMVGLGTTLPASGGALVGWSTGGGSVLGALPDPFPTGGFQSGSAPRLIAKIA